MQGGVRGGAGSACKVVRVSRALLLQFPGIEAVLQISLLNDRSLYRLRQKDRPKFDATEFFQTSN